MLRAPPLREEFQRDGHLTEPTGAVRGLFRHISPEGQTFGELAASLKKIFSRLNVSLNLPRSRTKFSGSIFPLPETFEVDFPKADQLSGDELNMLQLVSMAMNSYYGVSGKARRPASKAVLGAVEAMTSYVTSCGLCSEKFEGLSWDQFMETRSVDYRGEEVKVARSFQWENIEPGFPEGVGTIPLVEICELGTLDYVQHFEKYLLPEESRIYTKPPRIFVEEYGWERVCSGLLERGVCRLLPLSEVYHLQGKPVFSGLFAVTKNEMQGSWEVMRLIMNLIPVNKLCRSLGGDISTLPSWSGMSPYVLGDSEDKSFPIGDWIYRVYLDNFDSLQKVDKSLAEQISGKVSVETVALREGYLYWGLPRHPKKSVQQELQAEISGAWVDGLSGKVRPKPEKVMKYVELALLLLRDGRANQKQMQVICGGLVYCCMFRRALLGLLNRVWTFICEFNGDPPVVKRELPPLVQLELVRFIGA
eukprot:s785_g4.t1